MQNAFEVFRGGKVSGKSGVVGEECPIWMTAVHFPIQAGHSPLGISTFFGTQNAKPLHQCKKPMKNVVGKEESWNSILVGFSFRPQGHKTEIR
ncbi:hypothetical protein AVEN_952-1 [Araneus ventricosus]|uniref:Uncharacterized protein n=1 Tax=Araneus ventricosus TaxID=182803 RepID=A0A4Y2CZM0_ARAVE|nr:hypothetical protein AVEN_952-1 [Araneus ventricosus]